MGKMGSIDKWNIFYLAGSEYNHFSHPLSVHTQMDYFLMDNAERYRIICCDIEIIDISDPSPLCLTINLNQRTDMPFIMEA